MNGETIFFWGNLKRKEKFDTACNSLVGKDPLYSPVYFVTGRVKFQTATARGSTEQAHTVTGSHSQYQQYRGNYPLGARHG